MAIFFDEARRREFIRKLRLMDDVFMTAYFKDNIPCTQLMLRIILNKPDLIVKRVRVQSVLKNLYGRSLELDIDATDSDDKDIDIEIQRRDEGAIPLRARYISSLMDANANYDLGKYCEKLREHYVVFITENDVLKGGLPLYTIDRHIRELARPFGDGSHILYVNGAMRFDDTPLSLLMHDFFCTEASDMHYGPLAERMRDLKETSKGANVMSSVMDEMRELIEADVRRNAADEIRALVEADVRRSVADEMRELIEADVRRSVADEMRKLIEADVRSNVEEKAQEAVAVRMIEAGKIPLKDIAAYSALPLATVDRLAARRTAPD